MGSLNSKEPKFSRRKLVDFESMSRQNPYNQSKAHYY